MRFWFCIEYLYATEISFGFIIKIQFFFSDDDFSRKSRKLLIL